MTKTIFGKVRKALGIMSALTSEKGLSREAHEEQVNLIKVGRFWWLLRNTYFLRNSRQHATAASHWIENNSLLWRHSWLRNNLRTCSDFSLFLFVIFTHFCTFLFFVLFEKWVPDSIFSGLFPSYDEKYLGPLKFPFNYYHSRIWSEIWSAIEVR